MWKIVPKSIISLETSSKKSKKRQAKSTFSVENRENTTVFTLIPVWGLLGGTRVKIGEK